MEFSFYTGVLGPSYGFSDSFGRDDNSLTGLHGIMVHTGELLIGVIFALFSAQVRRVPRYRFMVGAVAMHYVAYAMTLMNVPAAAPMGATSDDALLVVPSSAVMAGSASFILGIGTGLLDTQVT